VLRAVSVPLVLGGLCAMAAAGVSAPLAAQSPEPFIQVSGTAQVQVPSDRARLNFAVVTEATTAAEATTQNATQMDAVARALRATGAAGLNIETWGYDLQPRYSRPTPTDQTPRIVGYQATNNVRVTVDDVTVVGRLIDAAVTGGANRITSLRFEARDAETARIEALRRAVQNAHSQAEAMASALGVVLGPPLEVHGGAQAPMPPPMPYMEMARMDAMVDTPIEAADQTVSANVTIRYALGGR